MEEEDQKTILISKIINRIVADNKENSERVIPADTWDMVRLTDEEMQRLESLCAPRSVVRRKYRDKWKLPQLEALKFYTLPDLFPEVLLEEIQRLTQTVLISSHDRSFLWIGADSEREAAIAKKKLTTLANCWVCLIW